MSEPSGIKIIQTIASGGTAVLYKAVQTSLDRIVAVKRLHAHLTDDENFTRRFILEAKAAASLDHENIVHVIDFGREGDSYQMVMEYVEGESLKDVLERWRPVRYDLALAIVHQICRGLEHAHGKGIVHRDIKPGNVMLTRSGKAKIADFGLAKLVQGTTSQTAANAIMGTPLYMSPEQAFGESVDQRSDLFSLGTVLYELLTGRQPFASENYMGVIQNIIHGEIPHVRDVVPEIPTEVEAIVTAALAKTREDRFQSAREFREAIEAYVGIVRLNATAGEVKVLLETDTATLTLPNPHIARKKPRPRKQRSGRGVFAALAFLFLAGATGVVITRPDLVARVGLPVPSDQPGIIQDASSGQVDFDLGTLVPQDTIETSEPAAESTPLPATEPTNDTTAPVVENTPPIADTTVTPRSAAPSVPEAVPPRRRQGYLVVDVSPSAEIYIDGVYKGDSPPALRLTLTAGQHTLDCRNARHETYREVLKITNGELSRRSIRMRKLVGIISLATDEGAQVYVDGRLVGTTPIRRPIEVEVGAHMLSIQKPEHHTWSSEVTIDAGKTLPLKITLSKRY